MSLLAETGTGGAEGTRLTFRKAHLHWVCSGYPNCSRSHSEQRSPRCSVSGPTVFPAGPKPEPPCTQPPGAPHVGSPALATRRPPRPPAAARSRTGRTHRSGPRPSSVVRKSKKRALCPWFCCAEPTTPMEETSSWAQGSAEPASTMGIPLRTVTFTRCRHTRGHVTVSLPPPPPPPAPRSPRRVCPEWWRWLRTASGAAPAAAARPAGWSPAPRTAWPLPALRSAPLPGASLSLRPAPLRPSSPPALFSSCPPLLLPLGLSAGRERAPGCSISTPAHQLHVRLLGQEGSTMGREMMF